MPNERMDRIERDLDEVAALVRELGGTVIEHTTRLSNGREIMDDMKEDIVSLRPKVPDWLKFLGAITVILGGYSWVLQSINDRPTLEQVGKIVHEHVDNGHPTTSRDIGALRDAVIIQGNTLKGVAEKVTEQGQKIDVILYRTPRR